MSLAYATVQDFRVRFGVEEARELSNLEHPEQQHENTPILQARIDDAIALVNSYLSAAGYSLPLPSPPPVLRPTTLDIARYWVDRVRDREAVRLRYEDAINWLKSLVDGDVDLGLDAAGAIVPAMNLPDFYTEDRVFTMDKLVDW